MQTPCRAPASHGDVGATERERKAGGISSVKVVSPCRELTLCHTRTEGERKAPWQVACRTLRTG